MSVLQRTGSAVDGVITSNGRVDGGGGGLDGKWLNVVYLMINEGSTDVDSVWIRYVSTSPSVRDEYGNPATIHIHGGVPCKVVRVVGETKLVLKEEWFNQGVDEWFK